MTAARRYRLLCPIARALDAVGDRWSLLILRDLHAGPARFTDLLTGLQGIASNLLTDRLQQLAEDGLIEKQKSDYGVVLYALTDLGEQTDALLFELALFGGLLPPDAEPRRPGNLRTIAVTLKVACQRVVTSGTALLAALQVDDEPFTLRVRGARVEVRSGAPEAPEVTLKTAYEPMVAAGDGRLSFEDFVAQHVEITAHKPGKDLILTDLLGRAMAEIRVASATG